MISQPVPAPRRGVFFFRRPQLAPTGPTQGGVQAVCDSRSINYRTSAWASAEFDVGASRISAQFHIRSVLLVIRRSTTTFARPDHHFMAICERRRLATNYLRQ